MPQETPEMTEATTEHDIRTGSCSWRHPSQSDLESRGYSSVSKDSGAKPTTSTTTTVTVITSVTLVMGISTLLSGLTTVILPTMATDLEIPGNLLLWPSSIQALTCGCALLASGAIADALGSRLMYIVGSILQTGFTLGCGLSRNALQIIIFRGLSGIAVALCLPSATAIITSSLDGQRRNFAFASMGGRQPIGFTIGLVIGGVLADTIGWRWGYYISAIVNTFTFVLALGLPQTIDGAGDEQVAAVPTWSQRWRRFAAIDWIGALIITASLALLSYLFASLSGDRQSIKQPSGIVPLVLAILLIPVFIFWTGFQERRNRHALIPNHLWKDNRVFVVICIAVFFTWASFNGLETIMTFYLQEVQQYSPIRTSLYFLPEPIAGLVCNLLVGYLVSRVDGRWLTVIGCGISLGGPLAVVDTYPGISYWYTAFIANILSPIGADTLFTISNLIITANFPAKTQALAGGVFNTASQIGKTIGLGLVEVIAADITQKSQYQDKSSPQALLEGYKATFWFDFGCIIVTVLLATWGLRDIGKVGHKAS